MSLFDSIKQGFQNHFDKKKEDQEFVNRLRLEAQAQKKIMLEEQFKKDTLEVAKAQAKKESASLSGLQKLRAINRKRNLNKQESGSGSFFEKLSAHTKRNLANREENLKKTEELRKAAKQMREEAQAKRIQERQQRMLGNRQLPINQPLRKWQK